jgi:hypothetical protein
MRSNHTHVQFLNDSFPATFRTKSLSPQAIARRSLDGIALGQVSLVERTFLEETLSHDSRRITLISRDPNNLERDWNGSRQAPNRLILLDSFTVLRYAISSHFVDLDVDVERLILDRNSSPAEYLSLLAGLPHSFTGDVVLISADDSGFLSALGRGGDRVLYSLSSRDLHFYLETHALVGRLVETEEGGTVPVFDQQFLPRHVM